MQRKDFINHYRCNECANQSHRESTRGYFCKYDSPHQADSSVEIPSTCPLKCPYVRWVHYATTTLCSDDLEIELPDTMSLLKAKKVMGEVQKFTEQFIQEKCSKCIEFGIAENYECFCCDVDSYIDAHDKSPGYLDTVATEWQRKHKLWLQSRGLPTDSTKDD